jgi:CheY-like chemotaxis protein
MKSLRKALPNMKGAVERGKRIRPLENRHFLLVEEPPDRRKQSLELLEKAGAEVMLERHALTGVAVALSMPERFDALILDVKRKPLEIIEASIALRAAGFDRPIIALIPGLHEKGQRSLQHAGCHIIHKNSEIASAFVGLVAGFIRSKPAA